MVQTTKGTIGLEFDDLAAAVDGDAAAIRVVTKLEPAGGPGDKVFPPTYQGGIYATEKRRIGDTVIDAVVLDSVQSQANRLELALRSARERGELRFPLIVADFSRDFPHIGRITALDAPHRIADAIFRESLREGTPFRDSDEGQRFASARPTNATPLFELCPTALVFGVWDSTGPRGGLGAKFARALVSEIVGFDAVLGVRTASRVDPLPISVQVTIYETKSGGWTLLEKEARRDERGQPVRYGGTEGRGRPSTINLGNVTPDLVRVAERDRPLDETGRALPANSVLPGGVTISHAVQTAVLSLPALRRLRFPLDGGKTDPEAETAARTTLAALALASVAYQRREGYDLRSRCLLVPVEASLFELVPGDGGEPRRFTLRPDEASGLFATAVAGATKKGLPWREDDIELSPSQQLIDLVRRSEELGGLVEEAAGE